VAADETDVRLHARLVAGDDDALGEAYDRWSDLVFSLAVRITNDHGAAEDVTQDVFVSLWERPARYDPDRGSLRSWLCLLARSRAIDSLRRAAARERVHAATAAQLTTQAEIDEALIWETEAKVVREAIHALPDPQRDAVVLAYRHGRTYRQVATELDIPEGTAKSRLRGALAMLADRLESEGIIER
jgi:RNA polymerase sigma-70 factor (ECF subfamily)